eukprot:g4958.t1
MAGMILDSRDDQGGALRSAAEDTPLMPEWTAELEEQRVWKIVKRKIMAGPGGKWLSGKVKLWGFVGVPFGGP